MAEKNKGGRPKKPNIPRNDEGYYNHREVAELLRIHPDTVHKLTRINRIPAIKMKKGIGGLSRSGQGHELRYDLFYPKDAIHALRDKLYYDPTANTAPTTTQQTPPTPSVNGTESFGCPVCNTDIPINEVVSHQNWHIGKGDKF